LPSGNGDDNARNAPRLSAAEGATYASWRWVLLVNVPVGVVVALTARRVLGESNRQRGRFDVPGAVAGTAGTVALVYGLSNAAAGPAGVSHWGDARVVISLAASAVLLAAFVVIEARSKHALLPLRLLRDRDRAGAYLIMLCVGTSSFGLYFFLTLFMQMVWGYSALRTGLAYLPFTALIVAATGAAAQLVPRIGARPLLIAGCTVTAGGLYWQSQVTEHSTYASGVLGPMLVNGVGIGLLYLPLSLIALSGVREHDSGIASSLLNAGQEVGGSIGLAVLGTVAWTAVATTMRARAVTYPHALAAGFSRGFLVGGGIMLLALAIAIVAIRVRRADPAQAQDSATCATTVHSDPHT